MSAYKKQCGLLVGTALMIMAARGADSTTDRQAQLKVEITQVQELIAETTNATERTYWQQRLDWLQQDLRNQEQRVVLDEKEHQLVVRQERQADYRLRELLRAISTDVAMPSNDIVRIDAAIRNLKVQRSDLEQSRRDLTTAGQTNVEQIAELNQHIHALDEDVAAQTAERETAEIQLRLVSEARRIGEMLQSMAINPRVSLGLLREKQQRLDATLKGRADTDDLIAIDQQQREGVAAALNLSREKVAHLEAEQVLVNKRNQGVKGWFKTLPLYFSGNAERKYLTKCVTAQQQQLGAMDATISAAGQLRDLLSREADYLRGERQALLARFEQRLLFPVGTFTVLILGYLLFSRLLAPHLIAKDHLTFSRRIVGYLCSFIGLVVLVMFFLEDLRSVATILGIASAAIVIALQDMCSAFAGWFVIMSGRKFSVGDRVEIDGNRGDVIDIQLLRTTLIEVDNWLGVDEPTGRIIVVPNSFVFKSKFFNYTYLHPFVWHKLDITVTYETPAKEAQALLLRILEEETRNEFAAARSGSDAMEKHYGLPDAVYQPKIYSYIADSGVQFRLLYVAHYKHVSSTRTRINARVIQEFEKNPRMQFAYPTERHIPTPEKGTLHVALEQKN